MSGGGETPSASGRAGDTQMNPFVCSDFQSQAISQNITNGIYDGLEDFHDFYKSIHPFISVAICCIGTMLNTATILVLTRPSMLGPINALLCSIAICDLIVMISNSVFVSHFLIVAPSRCVFSDFSFVWAGFMLFHAHTSVISHSTSLWITVALAHVRVFSVKRASKGSAQECLPTSRAVELSLLFLILVLLCNTPNFMAFAVMGFPRSMDSPMCSGNSTLYSNDSGFLPEFDESDFIYFPVPSDRGKENNCFLLKLSFWTNGIVFKVLPCILLTIFIIFLLRILASVRERNRNLALSHFRNQNFVSDRTTSMLVAVLAIFLLTELPQGALSVLTGVFSGSFRYFVYRRLGDFMDFLSLVNSSVNFFIYCSMSAKFREVFCGMFLPARLSQWFMQRRQRSEILIVSPNRDACVQEPSSVCLLDIGRPNNPSNLTAITNTTGNSSRLRSSFGQCGFQEEAPALNLTVL